MASTTPSDPVIRPDAAIIRVHDGDTYLFLLDVHGRGLKQDGCETLWVRLRDYSARELGDVAAADPKGLGRVPGPDAQSIAQELLVKATQITVELMGPEGSPAVSFDRHVGWVWVDGQSLGQLLAAQHAVAEGKFEGDPSPGTL